MLRAVNLSLSSLCGAKCIFCPTDLGKGISTKIMGVDTVSEIVKQISELNQSKKHNITHVFIGEQGDAFLNPKIIEILEIIKKLPNIKVGIFTNFQNVNKDKAEYILKNKLIDIWYTNIDGYKQSYYKVKRINFDNIINNVKNFVKYRDIYHPEASLTVFILSYKSYIMSIKEHFGVFPQKIKAKNKIIFDDFYKTEKYLIKKIINPKIDVVKRSGIFSWAEREQIDVKNVDYKKYNCPQLNRIRKEAFIAPDGTWYACCYDSKNNLNLGNIRSDSIENIFKSEKRMCLLNNLENKNFAEIGGPCITIPACEYFSYDKTPLWFKIKIALKTLLIKAKLYKV